LQVTRHSELRRPFLNGKATLAVLPNSRWVGTDSDGTAGSKKAGQQGYWARAMATRVSFETVRKLGLALPNVEEGMGYGKPALKGLRQDVRLSPLT
jgi:hypothetical protein